MDLATQANAAPGWNSSWAASPGATLHALYRESEDPVARSRWHAIWLLATGHSIPEVAQTLGHSTRWVRDTLHRYRPRHAQWPMPGTTNPGQPPLLPPELQEAFRPALLQPHPRDGVWTIRNAAEWLSERSLTLLPWPSAAWTWVKRLGFALLRPRPRHRDRDLEEGEAFKKNSSSPFSS
jgi:transposase